MGQPFARPTNSMQWFCTTTSLDLRWVLFNSASSHQYRNEEQGHSVARVPRCLHCGRSGLLSPVPDCAVIIQHPRANIQLLNCKPCSRSSPYRSITRIKNCMFGIVVISWRLPRDCILGTAFRYRSKSCYRYVHDTTISLHGDLGISQKKMDDHARHEAFLISTPHKIICAEMIGNNGQPCSLGKVQAFL